MPREVAASMKSRLAMERNILSFRVRVSLCRPLRCRELRRVTSQLVACTYVCKLCMYYD